MANTSSSETMVSATESVFDFEGFCARIGYNGPRNVSVSTLKALHHAFVHKVPFENLDIHLGKPLSLKPTDLFAKIVSNKRGGYCYEVNSFFAMALRAFGFQLHGLLARVLYGFADTRPRSHQALLVNVDGEPWLADVGFGSCCLREPLRLISGVIHDQGPDRFRLRKDGDLTYVLEALLVGRWQDLYSFTLEPFELVDFEPFNYWNSTSPDVRWTKQKVCSLPTQDGRIVAVDWEFKSYNQGGSSTVKGESDEEYRRLLREFFQLEISGEFIK